jgi:hypothetical protein
MIRLILVLTVTLVFFNLTACTRRNQERFVVTVGYTNLLEYIDQLSARGGAGAIRGEIPEGDWPASFRKAGVLKVKHYGDGFMIALERHGKQEYGIYVALSNSARPSDGSGVDFDLFQDRIYLYDEKIRTPYRAPGK